MWTQTILLYLLYGVGIIFVSLFLFIQYKFTYWRRRNVPYDSPEFPFGYMRDIMMMKKHFISIHTRIYNDHPTRRYVGVYSLVWPGLIIRDPDIIKPLLTTNFEDFSSRGVLRHPEVDPYTESILSLDGNDTKWKNMRSKMDEVFATGKIRICMFDTMVQCGEVLNNYLKKQGDIGAQIELKDVMSRYALDVAGSTMFGVQCQSFEDSFNPYRMITQETNTPKSYHTYFRFISAMIVSELMLLLRMSFCESQVIAFYGHLWGQIEEQRKNETVRRNDLADVMLNLMRKPGEEVDENDRTRLKKEDMIANMIFLMAASYESTSSMLTFAFHNLAFNHEIQEKARNEVQSVVARHGGFTYEAVMEMKYVEAIVDEVLRLYPPVPILVRMNKNECKLPNTNLMLDKGTRLIIPSRALLRDPNIFPEPDTFDPDRKVSSVGRSLMNLPFGLGPRVCPGKRQALVEGRVAIAMVLSRYRVRPAPNMRPEVVADPGSFTYLSKHEMWAIFEEISSDINHTSSK